MSRIYETLKNKKSFIPFLTAGDPSLEKTEEFIIKMAEAGAALVEIGIPFSDPIAEGPVIQDANVRALSAPGGCTTDMVFDMVERVSKKVNIPLVFLT
ncbi:MAG: tryptophan synthase subunit alpha, partial [Lachnospiraceae bacterium]|nr:tryptophan synthase subunit alpha [Lachnospiraceae bacterium]